MIHKAKSLQRFADTFPQNRSIGCDRLATKAIQPLTIQVNKCDLEKFGLIPKSRKLFLKKSSLIE